MNLPSETLRKILETREIWLLLDYDGTLVDFAPTPDDVNPDPELITLVRTLSEHPKIVLAIISGRRLSHIEKLVPVSNAWLAGSYGLEIRTPNGEYINRVDYELIRPKLNKLKPAWVKLIKGKTGFYLEDKGWSLALHARFAEDQLTDRVLYQAHSIVKQKRWESGLKILGGYKFLEIAPKEADKGKAVSFLLEQASKDQVFPIYIGDDDKDELAFPVVQEFGGLAGCVCDPQQSTSANFYLSSPQDTREWLAKLVESLG